MYLGTLAKWAIPKWSKGEPIDWGWINSLTLYFIIVMLVVIGFLIVIDLMEKRKKQKERGGIN